MNKFLFEVSWEICNKVGGINTVIRSKAIQAVKSFGQNYFLLGPDLGNNQEFIETDEKIWQKIKPALEKKGLFCRFGRWQIEGEPLTILVSYKDRYDINKLLFDLWKDFGVDSYGGEWEYIEPVIFSTACAEVIDIIYDSIIKEADEAIAHFHEWMCGAGVLYLKKNMPEIATVFTTHATILGRSMAGAGIDIYTMPTDSFDPQEQAKRYSIIAKYSMEQASAINADSFTTVSEITAEEATVILEKKPTNIVLNGLNMKDIKKDESERLEKRRILEYIAGKFLQEKVDENTLIWLTSGRYEFHNKGYDIVLKSIAKLNQILTGKENAKKIVLLTLIGAGHLGISERARQIFYENKTEGLIQSINVHKLWDENNDQILQEANNLGLDNNQDQKIKVIFSTAYMDGHDGIFNLEYYDILKACDLTIFPSFYEPWGYTPLESIAMGVPTITTDLAGFGKWAQSLKISNENAVSVIERKSISDEVIVDKCVDELYKYAMLDADKNSLAKENAFKIANLADWSNFYHDYLQAYETAIKKAKQRSNFLDASDAEGIFFKSFSDSGSFKPRFKSFVSETALPDNIKDLKKLAYNLWWAWHKIGKELFFELDEELWQKEKNPIKLLNKISSEQIEKRAHDQNFLNKYQSVMQEFNDYYTKAKITHEALNIERPVAYFSMEYGIDECLPIYSGGLGILSGDHLKSASDLNIPLIGIGLLYKQGYFIQELDNFGRQKEVYQMLDCANAPMTILQDEDKNEVKVEIPLPGRVVYARVWLVMVGRVKLYLLDTDLQENAPQDREITFRLYGGDRKYRIKQEIVLGIGGIRLIKNVLKIKPSVYHLNEGHSAFLLLERLKVYLEKGLSFQEAREIVKVSSVFTTHTPVPAGNEAFDFDLIRYYLGDYVKSLGIDLEEFIELGKIASNDINFSMTVFALKLTNIANGVSKLHGLVSRDMWKDIWQGLYLDDIPIDAITNGVHLLTWLGQGMIDLYSDMGIVWHENETDKEVWEKIKLIPNDIIWYKHQEQKIKMLENLKTILKKQYNKRGETQELIEQSISNLNPDVLTIGFARRFATYKRAYLIFNDLKRLANTLNKKGQEIQIIIAGKAHPSDLAGKDIIKAILDVVRNPLIKGRVVFIEDYDIELAKDLVQGVDIWLNNPVFPKEASGTSGMKAGVNGVINLSVLDGWWYEAFKANNKIGFGIDSSQANNYDSDYTMILEAIENDAKNLYYQKNDKGISDEWVEMMKNSIQEIAYNFSSNRMVFDYYNKMYLPSAQREHLLYQNNYKEIKELTDWKRKIRSRFMSAKVRSIKTEGIKGDILNKDKEIKIDLVVEIGKLKKEEIIAEFIIGTKTKDAFNLNTEKVEFVVDREFLDDNAVHFKLNYKVKNSGSYFYGIRIMPYHKFLIFPSETGLVYWL